MQLYRRGGGSPSISIKASVVSAPMHAGTGRIPRGCVRFCGEELFGILEQSSAASRPRAAFFFGGSHLRP